MSEPLSKTTRILWAVDLFDSTDMRASEQFLQQLVDRAIAGNRVHGIKILPAIVVTPSELSDLSQERTAQKAATNWVRPERFPKDTLEQPVILSASENHATAFAEELYREAERTEADLILVHSHSRSGISRWIKGSVAEELSIESDIPILILGKNFRMISNPDAHRVLFATDFSENSLKALRKLTPLLRLLRAQLHLYHGLTLESPLSSSVMSHAAMGSDTTGLATVSAADPWQRMKILESLRNETIQEGVPCTYELDPKEGSLVDRVLQAAQRNQSSWIALAGVSSKKENQIWGSLSRELARESALPTWLMHVESSL